MTILIITIVITILLGNYALKEGIKIEKNKLNKKK